LIGLNVAVSAEAECEPDKSNRHHDGAGYDHPMWISHLGIPSFRSFALAASRSFEYLRTTFRAAPAARGSAMMIAVSKLSVR
jgi:hypothetical protein